MSDTKCWCGGKTGFRLGSNTPVCRDSALHDPSALSRPALPPTPTLYVAGPMSGYPESNYPAFSRAADRLREEGFLVVNPATDNRVGFGGYTDFLRDDLRLLLECDGVAVLDYWWESVGARNEVSVAGVLRMPVRTVDEWVDWIQPISGNGDRR